MSIDLYFVYEGMSSFLLNKYPGVEFGSVINVGGCHLVSEMAALLISSPAT